jgi:hypothetical protein
MNHFYARNGIEHNSCMLNDINFNYFTSETNISKNSDFFIKYFGKFNKDTIVLPYVYQNRFKNITPFKHRKNLAIATGTFVRDHKNKEMQDFFGSSILQPMRLAIYDKKDSLVQYIDSYLNDFKDWDRYRDKYMSFDIVAKYNEYKMSIIPEEIIGLPAIGFVESMACGCAYRGIDSPMYRDIGLIPGEHYIAYNGTLEGLKKVIDYYQTHNDELEKIAETGCLYVHEKFNEETVAANFIIVLKEMIDNQMPDNH